MRLLFPTLTTDSPDSNMTDITTEGVLHLFRIFNSLDLLGPGPPSLPWGDDASPQSLKQALDLGRDHVSPAHTEAFLKPLEARLGRISDWTRSQWGHLPAEVLLGPVYQSAPEFGVVAPLRRLMAVAREMRDGMMDGVQPAPWEKASHVCLPPLAVFLRSGMEGPLGFSSPIVHKMIGASADIVCLPSSYRDHPVLWNLVAHEAAGHFWLNAVDGLLQELRQSVYALILDLTASLEPDVREQSAAQWASWTEEAAADVVAVLNLGPAFALLLVAWLAAWRTQVGAAERNGSTPERVAAARREPDRHPGDSLRIHLIWGAIGAMDGLGVHRRNHYRDVLKIIADTWLERSDAATALDVGLAQSAGAHIAAAPLRALHGKSLHAHQRWTDADEESADAASDLARVQRALATQPAIKHGMTGAVLAAMRAPGEYPRITANLTSWMDARAE